jgi:hypothetical protein
MDWRATRDQLLTSSPVSPLALNVVVHPGVYAWWDLDGALSTLWPAAFPPVDTSVPLYVGIAEKQSLAARIGEMHLTNACRSGLRRSLTPLLSESYDLMRGAVRHPRGKFGLENEQEVVLTTWMLANLRMTWVVHDNSGRVEKPMLRDLTPPLNDVHAAGSPYRVQMRALRANFRASAPLVYVPKASRSL